VKHPLPEIYQQLINRVGQYRTLREELAHDYQSSLFKGANRAMVRLSITLHPREEGYGGTVLLAQGGEEEWLRTVAEPVVQGLWWALADYRLKDFALVIHDLETAVSGNAGPLLTELAARAVRQAMREASLQAHDVPGWQPVEQEAAQETGEPPEDEAEFVMSGAERRAAREARRRRRREEEMNPRRAAPPSPGDERRRGGGVEGRSPRERRRSVRPAAPGSRDDRRKPRDEGSRDRPDRAPRRDDRKS
jgi:hypothetical protein